MTFKNRVTRNVFYGYLSLIVILAILRMLSGYRVISLSFVGDVILNIFLQVGVFFSIPVFFFSFRQKLKPKETLKFFGYKKIGVRAILIAFLIGIIVYILNIFVANFFGNILIALGYKYKDSSITNYPVWLLLLNLFRTAVLPAICEETAHRGLLLKGLSPLGKKRAIIISSVLFGLVHMNITQFFYATLIGLLLGYIASTCDSIYPSIIIHFMNNAISTFMGFASSRGLGLNIVSGTFNKLLSTSPVLAIVFVVVLLVLLSMLLYVLVKQLFKQTVGKRTALLQEEILREIAKNTYLQELEEVSQGNTNLPTQRNISFEEFDQIYKLKGIQLGHFTPFEVKLMFDEQPYKMDKITKALMITCFALSSIITIFTFVWGVL